MNTMNQITLGHLWPLVLGVIGLLIILWYEYSSKSNFQNFPYFYDRIPMVCDRWWWLLVEADLPFIIRASGQPNFLLVSSQVLLECALLAELDVNFVPSVLLKCALLAELDVDFVPSLYLVSIKKWSPSLCLGEWRSTKLNQSTELFNNSKKINIQHRTEPEQ